METSNQFRPSTKLFGANSLLALNLMLSVSIVSLIGIIFYIEITKPTPKYYVRNDQGIHNQIAPLEEPNISIDTLLNWAALATTSAYTMDFVDYQKALDDLKPYFTKTGYQNFKEAANKRIKDIVAQKLITTAVVTDTPVLLQEGLQYGHYSWYVQMPVLLSYQGASKHSTKQNIAVTLLITKVPTKDAASGFGIAQIQDMAMYSS